MCGHCVGSFIACIGYVGSLGRLTPNAKHNLLFGQSLQKKSDCDGDLGALSYGLKTVCQDTLQEAAQLCTSLSRAPLRIDQVEHSGNDSQDYQKAQS